MNGSYSFRAASGSRGNRDTVVLVLGERGHRAGTWLGERGSSENVQERWRVVQAT